MTGRKQAAFALLTAVCLVLSAGAALAQDPGDVRVGITYTPGYLPGLVMTPVEADASLGAVAAQADSILRRDLDYADRFQIVPVPDDLSTDGPVNYGLWNQLGAVWLVVSELTGTPAQPVLRVSLHDVVFSELKEGPPMRASEWRCTGCPTRSSRGPRASPESRPLASCSGAW
jgi:hypothetical protein